MRYPGRRLLAGLAACGGGKPPFRAILRLAQGSPGQTFVLFPLLVTAVELGRRRGRIRLRGRFLPLLACGYLQFRVCGGYRRRRGGGGPGMGRPPNRLVITGPYALSRNPMYLGHLIFTAGLALSFGSPLAWLLLAERWRRFSRQVDEDEERLEGLFGAAYTRYKATVPRWLPTP